MSALFAAHVVVPAFLVAAVVAAVLHVGRVRCNRLLGGWRADCAADDEAVQR